MLERSVSTPATSKLGLVIPTLNEADNIPVLIARLHAALEPLDIPYELIVVDDDSRDHTADLVRRIADIDSRVRLLVRKGQRGLSGAITHGWKQTDANLLGVIDADLQHPPEVLPRLVEAILQGSDIAIGSRYIAEARGSVSEWNRVRQLISRAGTLVTAPLQRRSGVRVADPLSGFFVVRREVIQDIDIQPQGFKILLEILVKGRIKKAVEIPFRFGTRHAGKSKADIKVALDYFSLLGKLSRHALFRPQQ
jgi:dolichol-phosphate mannosyltransferase